LSKYFKPGKSLVPCLLGAWSTNSTVTSFEGQRSMQYTVCESYANKLLHYTFLCGDLSWSYTTKLHAQAMEVLPVICLASFSGPEISEQTGEQGEVVPFQRGARRQNYTSTKMSSLKIMHMQHK